MEQFDRAQRYLERIRAAYEGVSAQWAHRREYEDDVRSFFVHCYHIRDWVVTLNRFGVTASDVDQFINSQHCLCICADLCNASKHCELTRKPPRSGAQPHVAGRKYRGHTEVVEGNEITVLRSEFTIMWSGAEFDVLELAERCMVAWREYIHELEVRTCQ